MAVGKITTGEANYTVGENCVVKQSRIGEHSAIEADSVVLQSTIGEYCDIEKRNLIRKATIGDMTYTGSDTSIMWATVGKYCAISRMVDIGGNQHNYNAPSMMPAYRIKNKLGGRLSLHPNEEMIAVGNDVWIGQGVSIVRKAGLTVGDGAVLGSGAVVTKSIPPYAIAVGVPARVVRYRFDPDTIERLLALRWWDWPAEKILENMALLTTDMTPENLDKLCALGE